MSRCETCASNKSCKYHGSSQLYKKNEDTPVIALLGQPNSGKSTIFNMMTGSHQHVGNWPGKTVDQKEGECKWNGQRMILADLPGSYSLSAGSDEEVITRDYAALIALAAVLFGVAYLIYLNKKHEKEIATKLQKNLSFGMTVYSGLAGAMIGTLQIVITGGSSALVWMVIGGFLNFASGFPIYLSFKKGIFYVQKQIKVGTHGEDYGSWMSNPVFYVFGGIALVTLVLTVLSFAMFHITALGFMFATATMILLALLCRMAWIRRQYAFGKGGMMEKVHQTILSSLEFDGSGSLLEVGCGSAH